MKMPSYVLISLLSAALYGFANPLMGVAQRMGLNTGTTIFSTCLGGLAVGIVYWCNHRDAPWPPIQASAVGVLVGAIWTSAMLLWTRALAPDMGSTASAVFLIVGTNPLIAVLVSATVFKEWDKVVLWKFFAGGGLIAVGLFLITTCKKVPAN